MCSVVEVLAAAALGSCCQLLALREYVKPDTNLKHYIFRQRYPPSHGRFPLCQTLSLPYIFDCAGNNIMYIFFKKNQ